MPTKRLLLAAILILALFLRLHRWDELPVGTHVDEAINILDALDIASNGGFEIWDDDIGGRPTLHLQIVGRLFQAAGASVAAARAVSAIAGILSVALMFLVAEAMCGLRVAALASLFLAVNHTHLHYSRLVFEASIAPCFLLLSLLLLLRAARRPPGLAGHAAAGAAAGLGLYTYASFRIAALIPIAWSLILAARRGPKLLWGTAALALAAGLAAAPLLHFALAHPGRVMQRYSEVSVLSRDGWSGLLENLAAYPRIFVDLGDRNAMQNLPGEPGFLLPVSIFFVAGLCFCLLEIRRERSQLMLAWLALGLLPAILTQTVETPHSTRSLLAFPAGCIIAANGLASLLDLAKLERRTALAFELCIALLALLANAHSYFDLRFEHRLVYNRFLGADSAMGRIARARIDSGGAAYIDANFFSWSGPRAAVLANALPREPGIIDHYTPPPNPDGGRRLTFMVNEAYPRAKLRALYPQLRESPMLDRFGNRFGWLLEDG